MPPTRDLACNPGMGPDWESNQQLFGLQASAHSTEPHQPGLILAFVFALDLKANMYKIYKYNTKPIYVVLPLK